MTDLTQALENTVRHGRGRAAEELLPLVYDELRRHAATRLAQESEAQTLQPTALVHEAWLRMFGEGDCRWENRAHFFGAASEAMRRVLIENARRKSRLKRGCNPLRVGLDQIELAAATPNEKLILIHEALERLRELEPVKAQVVVQKFFGGRTNDEVAADLGITERTVRRHWTYAKAWLFASILARQ